MEKGGERITMTKKASMSLKAGDSMSRFFKPTLSMHSSMLGAGVTILVDGVIPCPKHC